MYKVVHHILVYMFRQYPCTYTVNPLCYSWQPISLLLLPSFMISLIAYSLYLFPFTCCGLVSLNPFYIETFWTFDATIKFSAKSFSADTNDYLLLLADTNNITENNFLYFQKKFITCSLCTPENDRLRCSEQRWIILIFHSSNDTFLCGKKKNALTGDDMFSSLFLFDVTSVYLWIANQL